MEIRKAWQAFPCMHEPVVIVCVQPPVCIPAYRDEKGFASEVEVPVPVRAHAKQHHPPFPVLGLYKVSVPGYGYFMLRGKVAVGQHRVSRIEFIIPVYRPAACHNNAVVLKGAALGCNQVIIAVFII